MTTATFLLPPFRDWDEVWGTELPEGLTEVPVEELVPGDVTYYHVAGWPGNPPESKVFRRQVFHGMNEDPLRSHKFSHASGRRGARMDYNVFLSKGHTILVQR